MALTLKQYAEAKKLPLDFLKKLGLEDALRRGEPVVVIPYGDASGEEACVRYRAAMDDRRFFWETGAKPILYGLWREKQRRSKYMVLVEGESCSQTFWMHKLPAFGLPGANSWREEWAPYFDGYEQIYAVIEPDQGGDAVLKSLGNSGIRDRVRLVRLNGVKDASELYLSDPRNFRQNWNTAMEAAVPWSETEEETQQPRLTQTTSLLTLAEAADLFHTPDGEPFASVPVDDHNENWAVRSRYFRQWLLRAYYLETKSAPQSQAIQEAINVLESKANFGSLECPVFVRLAESEGNIYLDLCNERWEVVEVDATGWRLLSAPPVKFRRAHGMAPLPLPTSGGSIDQLRRS